MIDGTLVVASGSRKNIPYMAGTTSQGMMPPILLSMTKKRCAIQDKPRHLWYWLGTPDNCWRPM